ncbi:MAG: cell division protein ZapB [Thermodesulfovibrionales bacterium]|nr:cell division protein ZapB [Thermodesulfovibrionales bacterium]
MEIVKALEEKISYVVEKVKELKEEKNQLQKKVAELEEIIRTKDKEIEQLNLDKANVKMQLEGLIKELDSMEFR